MNKIFTFLSSVLIIFSFFLLPLTAYAMEKEKIDLEFAEALKRADKNIHEYLVLEPAWYFKPYCLNDLDAISSTYKEKLSNQKNKMGLHPTSIEKSNLAQA